MDNYSNAQMHKCANGQMCEWTNAQMRKHAGNAISIGTNLVVATAPRIVGDKHKVASQGESQVASTRSTLPSKGAKQNRTKQSKANQTKK